MQKIKRYCTARDPSHPIFEARNIFVLSYYFWGMNLIDLYYLQVGNFIDGRVKYERKKTHKRFDIRILPEIEPIIQFYSQGKRKEDYLLPDIKRTMELERDKDVLWHRKRYKKNSDRYPTCLVSRNTLPHS